MRLWAAVSALRQAIGARIAAALPGETGAIANALITGERGGISEATNAMPSATAASCTSCRSPACTWRSWPASVFFLVRLALAAFPAIALVHPIKKWAAAAAMLGAFAYLMISGASFATVRSAIMISIMLFAVILDRPALALRNVVLAATLILVLFPESLFDVGFQMSFAAVLALVSIYEALRGAASGGPCVPERPAARIVIFLRRHRAVDARRQRGRGAVRGLSLPQEPAVRRHRQPHRHSAVQRRRHAGGAGDADRHAARARGAAAVGDGLGHRRHGVDGERVARSAGRGAPRAGDPDAGVSADDRRRPVAGAVADALAIVRASR